MQTVPPSSCSAIRRVLPVLVALTLLVIMLVAPALAAAADPTVLTIETASGVKVWPYNAQAEFHGTLTDGLLNPVVGYTVQFQRSLDSVTWSTVSDVPAEPGPYSHQYSARYDFSQAAWFRFSFLGDTTWAASVSPGVLVKWHVSLSRPIAPKVVRHGTAFTSYGYLRPRHASGAKFVKIKCYRRSSSGSWSLKKTVWATDSSYRTYTKYKARFSLPTTGKWKLIALYPGTTKYATTTSEERFVTAK